MSVVVKLSEYRSKGVLTLVRELLVAASRGKIAGIRVEIFWKDGKRKACAAGRVESERTEPCGNDRSCVHHMR